jgi:putative membrane protein
MVQPIHGALEPWTLPVVLTVATFLPAVFCLRGWIRLRSASSNVIPAWRAGSFLLGVFLLWAALGSPLAALDMELLTVHMVQHLLLMTLGPALILLGAPVMLLSHGLPQRFAQTVLPPLFRSSPAQKVGHLFSQPVFCWLAAAAALVGWHVPSVFALGLHSHVWHTIEHVSFICCGFLIWWPVVQPWPRIPAGPRWSILTYLFLATLPCDILAAFLAFSDRVVYPVYLSTSRQFSMSALEDQQCAAALMWTCVTIIYLVPAAILTMRLLSAGGLSEDELA